MNAARLLVCLLKATGVQDKLTDYHGEYIYENDILQFANHEEGRVIMTGTEPEYQYHLKDHLGNVRMTYTTKNEVDSKVAKLEDETAEENAANFLRYEAARRVGSSLFDHTKNNNLTDDIGLAQRLNGTTNERVGLARSFAVKRCDRIGAEVWVKYVDHHFWFRRLRTQVSRFLTRGLSLT